MAGERVPLETLGAQGISQSGCYVTVTPLAGNGFYVNDWSFDAGGGTSGDATYPYMNLCSVDAGGIPNYRLTNAYSWLFAEITDDSGVAGQTNANPASLFANHQFAQIGGTFHDPRYGVIHTSLLDFDDDYLSGYANYQTRDVNELDVGVDLNGDTFVTDVVVHVGAFLSREIVTGTLEVGAAYGDRSF